MKIVFATNNAHKLRELREIMGDKIKILSLNDINCHEDIPETAPGNLHYRADATQADLDWFRENGWKWKASTKQNAEQEDMAIQE